ncbi:uncharacterized protein LOC120341600 [Styela clava]
MAGSSTPANNVFNFGNLKTKHLIAGSRNHITHENTEQGSALSKVDLPEVKPSKSRNIFIVRNDAVSDKTEMECENIVEIKYNSSKKTGNEGKPRGQHGWENFLQE